MGKNGNQPTSNQVFFLFCKLPPPGVVYHFNLQPQCFWLLCIFNVHVIKFVHVFTLENGKPAKFFLITYALFDSIVLNLIYQECLMNMDKKFSIAIYIHILIITRFLFIFFLFKFSTNSLMHTAAQSVN